MHTVFCMPSGMIIIMNRILRVCTVYFKSLLSIQYMYSSNAKLPVYVILQDTNAIL